MGCNSSQSAQPSSDKTEEPKSEAINDEAEQPSQEETDKLRKEEVKKWSSIVSNYSSRTEDTFQLCAEMSFNELPPEFTVKRILDLASGPGPTVREAIKRFPNAHVTATDFSDEMLKELKKRCDNSKSVETKLCSMDDLGKFKKDDYDLVVSQFGAEFLTNDEQPKFWEGVARVLAPEKGTCLISAWNEKTFLSVFMKAVRVQVDHGLIKLIEQKGATPLKEPQQMEDAMQAAGLEGNVVVKNVEWVFSSTDDAWDAVTSFSPKIKGIVERFTKTQRENVHASFNTIMNQYRDCGTDEIVLPCTFNLGIARKPIA